VREADRLPQEGGGMKEWQKGLLAGIVLSAVFLGWLWLWT